MNDTSSSQSQVLDASGSLFSLSTMDSASNVFSVDVQAFGMLLLEMMTAMSNSKQRQRAKESKTNAHEHTKHVTEGRSESPQSAFTMIEKEEEEETHVEEVVLHTDHGKSCTCSKKVTEIRVCTAAENSEQLAEVHVIDRVKMQKIQARKLPPIPLNDSTAFRQPVKECDDSTSDHSPKSTSPEHSPSNTLSSEKSSESLSDEHYNASSIGSLGSFDTIYEDEEQKSFHSGLSGTGRTARRFVPKPGASKRKAQHKDASWQKKRSSSGASYDDSVVSSDSGVGSSHYDVESSVVMNSPGSRNTIYSSESLDGDRFSLLMSYFGQKNSNNEDHTDSSAVISQHSAPAEVLTSDESTSTSQSFEEFSLPDLRIRKKPCRGDHPHFENGPCCHLPPVQSSKPPVPQKPNFRHHPPRSLKKPMPLPPLEQVQDNHDPIYEKIPTPRIPPLPAEYDKDKEEKQLVDMGTNTGDSLKKNKDKGKAHEESDRDEGISLDVASLVSMVQGLTDKPKSKENTLPKSSKKQTVDKPERGINKTTGHSQQGTNHETTERDKTKHETHDTKSFISVASSQTSDCCSKCGSNLAPTPSLQPSESRLSMSSRASSVHSYRPAPKLGVSAYTTSRRKSNASLGSSHATLRTPSSIVSGSVTAPPHHNHHHHNHHHQGYRDGTESAADQNLSASHGSVRSSAVSMVNDCNLILGNLDRMRTVERKPRRSSAKKSTKKSSEKRSQVKQAVHSIKQKGNLGYTAGQVCDVTAEFMELLYVAH